MKQQYEEYLEYQIRVIVNKLSIFLDSLFLYVHLMLEDISKSINDKNKISLLKPGLYFPIGLSIFILGIYLLFTTEIIFSPDYIVYFFFSVFFIGIFLYRND